MTCRDFQWQRDLVGLATAELLALGINHNHQILRANIGEAHAHRQSNEGVAEEHRRAHIERAQPGRRIDGDDTLRADLPRRRFEVVTAEEQRIEPGGGIGLVVTTVVGTEAKVQGADRLVTKVGRIGQYFLYVCIWGEGFALDDADGGQRTNDVRGESRRWLFLHDIIEQFEIAEFARWHRVYDLAPAFGELHRLLGPQERPVHLVPGRTR